MTEVLNAVVYGIGILVVSLMLSDFLDGLIKRYPRYLRWLHWELGVIRVSLLPRDLERIKVTHYLLCIHRLGIGFVYMPNRKKEK